MTDFIAAVVGEILIAVVSLFGGIYIRAHKLWLANIFNRIAREQAALVSGTWDASEKFSDDGSTAKYILKIVCRGAATLRYTGDKRLDGHGLYVY